MSTPPAKTKVPTLIRTTRLQCLVTRDDKESALAARDEYARWLRAMRLTERYGVGIERHRYAWQVWLYRYEA